jgi:hypothetical protein
VNPLQLRKVERVLGRGGGKLWGWNLVNAGRGEGWGGVCVGRLCRLGNWAETGREWWMVKISGDGDMVQLAGWPGQCWFY